MSHAPTSFGGSQEAGRTFSAYIDLWRTAGPCTTTPAMSRRYWRRVHEGKSTSKGGRSQRLCYWSWTGFAARGEGCTENCAHVRNAGLRLEERQDSGRETVTQHLRRTTWSSSCARFGTRAMSMLASADSKTNVRFRWRMVQASTRHWLGDHASPSRILPSTRLGWYTYRSRRRAAWEGSRRNGSPARGQLHDRCTEPSPPDKGQLTFRLLWSAASSTA
jgi:hypothetical protein